MPTGIYDRSKSKPRKKGYTLSKEHTEKMRKVIKEKHKTKKFGFQKGHRKFRTEESYTKGGKAISKALKGKYKGVCLNTGRTHFKKGVPNNVKENNPMWKGGRCMLKEGYVLIKQYNHPFRNCQDYVFEHRLVMEKHLGRYLTPEEIVHHNGLKYPMGSYEDKGDNRFENLRLFANGGEHTTFHEQRKK